MIAETAAFEKWLDAPSTYPVIDAPFLPGHRVRIQEKKAFRWSWSRGESRLFRVWIDDRDVVSVLRVQQPEGLFTYCGEASHRGECDCIKVANAYCGADPR
jgi:hypothetical protein